MMASSTTMPTARPSAEQGEGVEREAEEVDDRHGAEQRHRDREHDVERRRERAEEEPADERGQDHREEELELDLVDRLLDEGGGVEVDPELHPLGQGLLDLGDLGLDALRDRHGVGAALLADAQALRRHAVDARDAPDVLEAVLDERDVVEVDRRPPTSPARRRVGHHDLPQGLEVDRLAEDAHVDLAARYSMRPAGSSTCWRWSARVTSPTVSFFASSAAASTQMRTLRSMVPPSVISPTPGTVCSLSLTR